MKRIIEVPPNSFVPIDILKISEKHFRDVDDHYGKIISKTYTNLDTPLNYQNYITYDDNEKFSNSKTLTNNFWVSKVSNMYPRDFGLSESDYRNSYHIIVSDDDLETKYKDSQNFFFIFIIEI